MGHNKSYARRGGQTQPTRGELIYTSGAPTAATQSLPSASFPWLASLFVPAQAQSVRAVGLECKRSFTAPGVIRLQIWSDTAGSPGDALSDSAGTAQAARTAVFTMVFWDITPVQLEAGSSYWLVVFLPAPVSGGSTVVYTPASSGSPTDRLKKSSNLTSWSLVAANVVTRFTLYGTT